MYVNSILIVRNKLKNDTTCYNIAARLLVPTGLSWFFSMFTTVCVSVVFRFLPWSCQSALDLFNDMR